MALDQFFLRAYAMSAALEQEFGSENVRFYADEELFRVTVCGEEVVVTMEELDIRPVGKVAEDARRQAACSS